MKDWFLGSIPNNRQFNWPLFLIVSSPVIAATVKHGISISFGILFVFALFNCKGGWALLGKQEKRILIGFFTFFIFSAFSLLYSYDPKEGASFLERYARLVFVIPIYLMLRIHNIDSSRIFLLGAFLGVFVMVIQAFYQVEILNSEVAHGAYHKIILGDLAVLFAALIFIAMLYYAKSAWHYAVAAIAIMAGGYASLLSHTRAAWMFVPVFVALLIWLHRDKLNKLRLFIILIAVAIILSVLSFFPPEKLKLGFTQGMSDINKHASNPEIHSSWGSRLNMWKHSILIFKSMPIFGAGVGGYNAATRDLLAKGIIPESMKRTFAVHQSNAHSIYFQLLSEGGIVGFILMIITLFIFPLICLYGFWRSTSDKDMRFISLAGLTSIIAFIWFGMSTGWLIRNPPITMYCFVIFVFLSSAANRKNHLDAVGELRTKGE